MRIYLGQEEDITVQGNWAMTRIYTMYNIIYVYMHICTYDATADCCEFQNFFANVRVLAYVSYQEVTDNVK